MAWRRLRRTAIEPSNQPQRRSHRLLRRLFRRLRHHPGQLVPPPATISPTPTLPLITTSTISPSNTLPLRLPPRGRRVSSPPTTPTPKKICPTQGYPHTALLQPLR